MALNNAMQKWKVSAYVFADLVSGIQTVRAITILVQLSVNLFLNSTTNILKNGFV